MGGLDIYKTQKDDNGAYILPINLKVPVNSPADDFGMIIEESGERGYLTSSREGGKGGDDIYQFELPPLVLSVRGIVTDSKTGSIMTNIKVKLIGSDGSIIDVMTDYGLVSHDLNQDQIINVIDAITLINIILG